MKDSRDKEPFMNMKEQIAEQSTNHIIHLDMKNMQEKSERNNRDHQHSFTILFACLCECPLPVSLCPLYLSLSCLKFVILSLFIFLWSLIWNPSITFSHFELFQLSALLSLPLLFWSLYLFHLWFLFINSLYWCCFQGILFRCILHVCLERNVLLELFLYLFSLIFGGSAAALINS